MAYFKGFPRVIKLTRALHELGNKAEALGHALKDMAVSIASDETGRVLIELRDVKKHDSKANGGTDQPTISRGDPSLWGVTIFRGVRLWDSNHN